MDASTDQPLLRVVTGDATPEEIAALMAVLASLASLAPLASLGGGAGAGSPAPVSAWADPARGVRTPPPHGPGAWRASGLPR